MIEHIFVSATGQDDNLGDSVLRRGYLSALRGSTSNLHVLVGQNSGDYVSALSIEVSDHVYTEPGVFRRACMKTALREPTIFAFNTGEMRLDNSYLKTFVGHLPLVLATRLRGGGAIHTGYGIRAGRRRWRSAIRLILRLCTYVSWRDAVSRDEMRVGEVAPDWAVFGEQRAASVPSAARDRLVVSIRGDRGLPPESWFTGVRQLAVECELPIHVHSQVRRDNEMATTIADRLDAKWATPWPASLSHRDWELETARIYAHAGAVISDRIHALLIGAREGALPVGFTPASAEKARRTLAVLNLEHWSASALDSDDAAVALDRAAGAIRTNSGDIRLRFQEAKVRASASIQSGLRS